MIFARYKVWLLSTEKPCKAFCVTMHRKCKTYLLDFIHMLRYDT